jgi:hypothetical protein
MAIPLFHAMGADILRRLAVMDEAALARGSDRPLENARERRTPLDAASSRS